MNFRYEMGFSFWNNTKFLDPSYKTILEFLDCFTRGKTSTSNNRSNTVLNFVVLIKSLSLGSALSRFLRQETNTRSSDGIYSMWWFNNAIIKVWFPVIRPALALFSSRIGLIFLIGDCICLSKAGVDVQTPLNDSITRYHVQYYSSKIEYRFYIK